jgi:predicted anti-sigma-YlaC factor YlaD
MKCNEAKNLLLLKESGELSRPKETTLLSSHLQTCAECRQFEKTLIQSRLLFQPLEEPPAAVLNEIKREARRTAPHSKRIKTLYWKPALAMAASALIALGLFFTHTRPAAGGLELVLTETELLTPADQAIDVMYSGLSDDDLAFNFLMTYEEASEG